MDELEIITTADGSHTLRNRSLNETYHSIHGAVQESMHVFIRHGLQYYCEHHQPEVVSIFEVGMGTGLNALLTLQYAAQRDIRIRYTAIEPLPLKEAVWSKLNYADPDKCRKHFEGIHQAEWNREVSLGPGFSILKLRATLQEVELRDVYDVIYFDAFAPAIQPALWEYAALEKACGNLKPGGVFVTYSAKGQLKRDLKALGLQVETLAGPPGKNEMVRGMIAVGRR